MVAPVVAAVATRIAALGTRAAATRGVLRVASKSAGNIPARGRPQSQGPIPTLDSVRASVNIESDKLEKNLRHIEASIRKGTIAGGNTVLFEAQNYAFRRLRLFKHTARNESFMGLKRNKITDRGFSKKYSGNIQQVSVAGQILEWKVKKTQRGLPDHFKTAGYIAMLTPSTSRRAARWLKEKGVSFSLVHKSSQISATGSKSRIAPMKDAWEKVIEGNSGEIMISKVQKEIQRRI